MIWEDNNFVFEKFKKIYIRPEKVAPLCIKHISNLRHSFSFFS